MRKAKRPTIFLKDGSMVIVVFPNGRRLYADQHGNTWAEPAHDETHASWTKFQRGLSDRREMVPKKRNAV